MGSSLRLRASNGGEFNPISGEFSCPLTVKRQQLLLFQKIKNAAAVCRTADPTRSTFTLANASDFAGWHSISVRKRLPNCSASLFNKFKNTKTAAIASVLPACGTVPVFLMCRCSSFFYLPFCSRRSGQYQT